MKTDSGIDIYGTMHKESEKPSNLVTRELDEMEVDGKDSSQFHDFLDSAKYTAEIVRKNPHILCISFLCFVLLLGVSIALLLYIAANESDEAEELAEDLALETGRWFADQLDKAILPVFSLAQFVSEIPEFFALADQVGPLGEPGSRGMLPVPDGEVPINRNVSGICDDAIVLERFEDVARTIKSNADMQGVLVGLQLVPYQVVCMAYPGENTEDFTDGVMMNNSASVSLDLVAMPNRVAFSQSVLESDGVHIVGPFGLGTLEGQPIVSQAFIAASPVASSKHKMTVNGKEYNAWGSVEAKLNWQALVDRSDIFSRFEAQGKGFQLKRNDLSIDPETGDEVVEVVVLAETHDFASSEYDKRVSITLDTTDDLWHMTIVYKSGSGWVGWTIAIAAALSFAVSALAFSVLYQKQKFKQMKNRYLEDVAQPQKLRMRMFVQQTDQTLTPEMEEKILKQKPIADFYPATSVLFVDIVDFSSFASEREPRHVFQLLQTVYLHFNKIAKKRSVFKVDTLGDKYIAVTGMPDAQEDHAERMVKFAQECQLVFFRLCRDLEKELGPATGNLQIRMGIASGPITAGVIMGETSKFHLFGKTMGLASILEEKAPSNRIQFCDKTASLLGAAGKKKWIQPRKDKVLDDRLGAVQAHFLNQRKSSSTKETLLSDISSAGSDGEWDDETDAEKTLADASHASSEADKEKRLVDWQVHSFLQLLKPIIAYRDSKTKDDDDGNFTSFDRSAVVLDEVKEIIGLPPFDAEKARRARKNKDKVKVPDVVESQLRSFIEEVSKMYCKNPFHNFEHACHVVMATYKLLDRVATPEEVDYEQKNYKKVLDQLHKHTFGITSDPITHLAVVFSALIHDVDHRGVSNSQLAKENPELAEKYRNQSVAEQNSVDLGWDLLMQPKYKDLQRCIFCSEAEFRRFRQLVVNCVLATDIFDKELNALRNMRWEIAFKDDDTSSETLSTTSSMMSTTGSGSYGIPSSKLESTNRKATIVIEHVIQASDVAHTMQHWGIYTRWNEKLFQEMYIGWKEGRVDKNPALGWYKGEIWFFNNYVLKLANKLAECGVFGVAAAECLFNALENKRMWEKQGEELVEEMLKRCSANESQMGAIGEE